MKSYFSNPSLSIAAKITAIYLIFGLLWIFFSDNILHALIQDPDLYSNIQTYKGWLYVLVTAALLFHLIRLFLAQIHKTQQELVRAKEQAELANKAKSTFLASMSHELRTPLSGILGMLELMQKTGVSNEQQLYLETAMSTGHGLTALIGDILDLSKIEAGAVDMVTRPMKISAVMDFVSRNFSLAASKKGIELTSEIAPDVPQWVMADEMRIRQILFNLVGNAVKFTRRGSVTMRVEKSGETPDTYLLQVADTGVGIPGSDMPRITNPFTQADAPLTKEHHGAGLGLAIVKRLTELMGGDLRIESRENQGTTVSVLLPLKAAQEPMPKARDPKSENGGDTSGMSVLLVEDDPVNMFMLQKMLKVMGHDVHQAENGQDALAALERQTFDAVVMDVHMPGMNGLETTRAIRESRKSYADVPILALTAHALNTDQEKILDAGMDGYLAKPATMDELDSALQDIVSA